MFIIVCIIINNIYMYMFDFGVECFLGIHYEPIIIN